MFDALLMGLEIALTVKAPEQRLVDLHDELLKALRTKGGTPNWDAYPKARDYFTQRHP